MPEWNQQLFLLINASAAPNARLAQWADIIANSPVVVGPLLLVALWIWGTPTRRGALLSVAAGMLIGLGINQALGVMYFEPRPFMLGIGHTLLEHVPDNSFPSDHATFIWTLGIALIATRAAWRWGLAVCFYGVGVAWSRVYLGVHFPIDMIASMAVAVVSGCVARFGQPSMIRWALPWAERAYEASLRVLRVPPLLIPRHGPNEKILTRR